MRRCVPEKQVSGKPSASGTIRKPSAWTKSSSLFSASSTPTVENAQGNDVGPQYQTGIYYVDESSKETVERIAAVERERSKKFAVEIRPAGKFS